MKVTAVLCDSYVKWLQEYTIYVFTPVTVCVELDVNSLYSQVMLSGCVREALRSRTVLLSCNF